MENQDVQLGRNSKIASTAVLDTTDGPIRIGDNVEIGHFTVIYGNTTIGDQTKIKSHVVIGIAEDGYAMGQRRAGRSGAILKDGVTIRDGAHIYGNVELGTNTAVGHCTMIRTNVIIGAESQLAHYVSVERGVTLGNYVRSSPHTHLTGELIAEDRVFFGAGVKTVNDKSMHWRTQTAVELSPPVLRHGASVGSGSTLGAGVELGKWSMVGSHSFALSNVADFSIVVGSPAKHLRYRELPKVV